MPKGSYRGGKTDLPKKVAGRMREQDDFDKMNKAVSKMKVRKMRGKDGNPFPEGQASSITRKARGGMVKKGR